MGAQYSLNITPDGGSASLSSGGEVLATAEQLYCICAVTQFERGNDVVVGYDAPRVLETLAEQAGRRVFRRRIGPETDVFALDGVSLLLFALSRVQNPDMLESYLLRIPHFGVFSESVPVPESSSAVFLGRALRSRGSVRTENEIGFPSPQGWVTLRPTADGQSVRVRAEAASVEAARELCADIEDLLRLRRTDLPTDKS